MKYDEEVDTRIIVIQLEIWKNGTLARRGKSPKQDLTIEFPEEVEFPYHRLY